MGFNYAHSVPLYKKPYRKCKCGTPIFNKAENHPDGKCRACIREGWNKENAGKFYGGTNPIKYEIGY